jgi:hypothetical protein
MSAAHAPTPDTLWRDTSDPPGEPGFPHRGALARAGGVEQWEVLDRLDELRWRQREEARDRWQAETSALVRQGLA